MSAERSRAGSCVETRKRICRALGLYRLTSHSKLLTEQHALIKTGPVGRAVTVTSSQDLHRQRRDSSEAIASLRVQMCACLLKLVEGGKSK